MKPLRDPLGRPIPRLYFKTEELDARCEGIIRDFMERRSGGFRLPIPTDELPRLIEEHARDRGPRVGSGTRGTIRNKGTGARLQAAPYGDFQVLGD